MENVGGLFGFTKKIKQIGFLFLFQSVKSSARSFLLIFFPVSVWCYLWQKGMLALSIIFGICQFQKSVLVLLFKHLWLKSTWRKSLEHKLLSSFSFLLNVGLSPSSMKAIQKWWKMLFTSSQKLLSCLRYLNFFPDFFVMQKIDKKVKFNLKVYDVKHWTPNNCNTYIAQYL